MSKNKLLLSGGSTFDAAAFFLRLFVGIMMLTHGIAKILAFSSLSGSFPDPIGLGSTMSLVLITTTEVMFSVFVIAGLFTRLAVLPLIFGMIVAAFMTHEQFSLSQSELAIVYLGIYIAILLMGSGRYSADYLISRSRGDEK